MSEDPKGFDDEELLQQIVSYDETLSGPDLEREAAIAEMRLRLATLRAEVERVREELSPPRGCRWVAVSDELVAIMGKGPDAWGDPVRVQIEHGDDRVLRLVFKRHDSTARLAAERERCAKAADDYSPPEHWSADAQVKASIAGEDIAFAIRALPAPEATHE